MKQKIKLTLIGALAIAPAIFIMYLIAAFEAFGIVLVAVLIGALVILILYATGDIVYNEYQDYKINRKKDK